MATGMKAWVALTGVGIGLVSMWLLPPGENVPRPLPQEVVPEAARFHELESQLNHEHNVLVRLTWVDSLVNVLHAARVGDAASVVVDLGSNQELEYADPTKPALIRARDLRADAFRRRFSVNTAAQGIGQSEVDVGFFTLRVSDGPISLPSTQMNASGEYYVGEADGRAYCIATRVLGAGYSDGGYGGMDAWANNRNYGAVELCGFIARYGVPGENVRQWLKAGAWQFGSRTYVAPLPEAVMKEAIMQQVLSGERYPSLAGAQCLRGATEACGRLMLGEADGLPWDERGGDLEVTTVAQNALSTAVPELWSTRATSLFDGMVFFPEQHTMFADLEREFGAVRFETFWKSEQSVPVAFRTAFGVNHAVWMEGWEKSKYPEFASSYRTTAFHWAQAMILIALVLGLMMGVAKRRVVA